MGVLFNIVGILLRIILCCFGVLLVFAILLLLLPFFYKVSAEYQEGMKVTGRISWLAGFFSVSFSYPAAKITPRILGINILKLWAGRNKHKTKRKTVPPQKEKMPKKSKGEKKSSFRQDFRQEEEEEGRQTENRNAGQKSAERRQTERKPVKSKPTAAKKLRERWKRLKAFFGSIRRLFYSIQKKAEWAADVRDFWKQENTKRMVCILRNNVIHLWRKLKPKELHGKIEFGTADPCLTGQILGAAAVWYSCYGENIQILPNFEEAKFAGRIEARGRISLLTFLLILIRILTSKEWEQFEREVVQLKEAL